MMGYTGWGMMGGIGIFMALLWIVVFVDLVLLGVFLWKQIKK